MIVPQMFLALFLAVVIEASMLWWLDRRSARREAEFWEDLRRQAALDYGRLFDGDRD